MAVFQSPQVILFSDALARAAEFYARLGFVEKFRVPNTGAPIHIDLELDGYRIGVASAESCREDYGLDPVTTGQRVAVIVWTEDTVAAYRELTDAGVPGLAPPSPWLENLLIAWVADPDGNPVQLVQRR